MKTYSLKPYKDKIKEIKDELYDINFEDLSNMGVLGIYLLMSANLEKFLPHLDSKNHINIIKNIQFYKILAGLDQFYPEVLNNIKIFDPNKCIKYNNSKGKIFVTYHTGSYRLFILYLAKKNIKTCLVTQKEYIENQGDTSKSLFQQISPNNDQLEIIVAEDPRLIFKLLKKIQQGVSVVFYIDGNTGVTKDNVFKNNNLLKIKFLNHYIYARKGIALLAYLSKADIIIAISRRTKDLKNTINISSLDTKNLIINNKRNDFIEKVTEKLYLKLEIFLKRDFEQWEGWYYIEKFFDSTYIELESNQTNTISKRSEVNLVKSDNIYFINKNNKYFIVSISNYKIIRPTDYLVKVLNYFNETKKVKYNTTIKLGDFEIKWSFIEELIQLKFLTHK